MKKISSGKVREIYEVDEDKLLLVVSDRISAFDYILPSTPGMCNVIFWRFCRYPLVTNRGFGQNDGRDAGWNGIQIAWLSNIRSCDIVGNG